MSRDLHLPAPAAVATPAAEVVGETCGVCGGTSFAPMFGGRRAVRLADSSASAAYRITHSRRDLVRAILRCRECGLGVLPAGRRGGVSSAYEEGMDPSYLEQVEERIENAHRLLSLVPDGGRLLDVGCACGFLLLAARQRGFSVEGIEPSAWAAEYARREFQLEVWRGMLEEAPLRASSYNVVVMADTIEHLSDPRAALVKLRSLLIPGGRLLILTPDIGSPAARLAGVHWWGLLDDHGYYFNRQNLRRLLEDEGFAIEQIRAMGRRFAVRHWLYKLSQYSGRLQWGAEALSRTMHIDRLRVTVNLGDQMACVAQKQAK